LAEFPILDIASGQNCWRWRDVEHPRSQGGLRERDRARDQLLHRQGWRKLMPRLFHPKRDLAAQNAFKKRLSARRATARRRHRLVILQIGDLYCCQ
jgi:hypothetical protein